MGVVQWLLSKVDGPMVKRAAGIVGGIVAAKIGAALALTPDQVKSVNDAITVIATVLGGYVLTHQGIETASKAAGNTDAGK